MIHFAKLSLFSLLAPDFSKQFKLTVDASDVGIGAALFQEHNDNGKEKYSGNSRFSLSSSAKLDGKKYQLNVHEVRVNCLLSYQFSFKKSNAAEIGNPNSESTDSLAITSNKQNHSSLSVNARLRSGALSREAQFSHYLWVPRSSRPI